MRPEARGRLLVLFRRLVGPERAVVVDLAEVHRGERELLPPPRRHLFEREPDGLQGHAPVTLLAEVELAVTVAGRLALRLLHLGLQEVADGDVRRDALRRHARLRDRAQVDVRARRAFEQVALCFGQKFEEGRGRRRKSRRLHRLDDAAGVAEGLHGLDARDVVEEPAAARVHRQGSALRFEERERAHLLIGGERARGVPRQKLFAPRATARAEQLDVLVARGPRVAQQVAAGLLELRREVVAQEVEGRAQRRAPALVPAAGGGGVAAAVARPAAQTVRAAPRGALAVRPRLDDDLVVGLVLV